MFAKKENYKLTSPVLDCDHPDVVLHLRVRGTDRVALLAAFFFGVEKKHSFPHFFSNEKKSKNLTPGCSSSSRGSSSKRGRRGRRPPPPGRAPSGPRRGQRCADGAPSIKSEEFALILRTGNRIFLSHHLRLAPGVLLPDPARPVGHQLRGDHVQVDHAVGRVAHEGVHHGAAENVFEKCQKQCLQ